MTMSRRQLFRRAGGLGLGMAFVGAADSVFAGSPAHAADPYGEAFGYGDLQPTEAGVLELPEGFTYQLFGWDGELVDGAPVPSRHDGMCSFRRPDGTTVLVRNHEVSRDSAVRVPAAPEFTFDPSAPAGTMTLELDSSLGLRRQYASLGGTLRNCAGGRTPWGTWLTCEETDDMAGTRGRGGAKLTEDHGWVFEVHPHDRSKNVEPVPLRGMGRFQHEAVAVDPETNVAYLTEDAATTKFGLFYRFRPHDPRGGYGSYRSGGVLEAMHVPGLRDLSDVTRINTRINHVEWVEVPNPSAVEVKDGARTPHPIRLQFDDDEITRSQKLEGAWYGRGAIYFCASFAKRRGVPEGQPPDLRNEHQGQVWRYEPQTNSLTLDLIFTGGRYDSPDNIAISPFGGGVVLAEDGDGDQYLVGVARNGRPYPIARNSLNGAELAGVTFSDDNRTLFGNVFGGLVDGVEERGVTFAIRGPWGSVSEADVRRSPRLGVRTVGHADEG